MDTLCIGLREARQFLVEAESFCAIRWASGLCGASWAMADVVEGVMDLAKGLVASFSHAKKSTNSEADHLTKEGVRHQSLLMRTFLVFDPFLLFL